MKQRHFSQAKSVIAIVTAALFSTAQAQVAAVSTTVTPVAPGGFTPPGLPVSKPATTSTENVATKKATAEPAAKVVAKPATAVQQTLAKEDKKTKAEINKLETRKFKPDGKNVFVSESVVVPAEVEAFSAIPSFRSTVSNSMPAPKLEPVVNAKQGETLVISVGSGALNRIQTPFSTAVVDTLANAEIKTMGGVILVAPGDEPISLIVREKDLPENAILLELIPSMQHGARDVRVTATFAQSTNKKSNDTDEDVQQDAAHPVAVKLKNLMRDLAKGKVPSGYSLDKGDSGKAECDLPGFATKQAQVLRGASMQIKVYVATNTSDGVNELDERGCSARHQLAAAAWPKLLLQRGEKTELFVIEAQAQSAANTSSRPSSLN